MTNHTVGSSAGTRTAPGAAAGATAAARPSITVIGSLNVDLVTYASHMPAAGETMAATSFHTGLGGKGANQAVACAKLSRAADAVAAGTVAVRMVGAVGDDAYGPRMTAGLHAVGIDVGGVAVRPGTSTGVAVILVDAASGGDNRILISAEANGTLRPAAFATLGPDPASLVLLQLEIPLDTVVQILAAAHRQGVPVLLNAAPAPPTPLPAACFPHITHLVVNESEAAQLGGLPVAPADADSLRAVAAHFHGLGVANVIVTLGGHGVYYSSTAATASTAPVAGHVAAAETTVVDTTAAGDTFIGAYAVSLVQGASVAAAVQWANRAAAMTVARRGAQESIPWRDEVE